MFTSECASYSDARNFHNLPSKLGCFAKPEVDFAQPCNLSFIDSFAIAGGEAKLYEVNFQFNVLFGKPDRRANCGKSDYRFQPFKLALIFK